MKISEALLSLWCSPRTTINKLTIEHSITIDLKIVLGLAFTLFLQIGLFIYLLDAIPVSEFLNARAFEAFIWIFISFAAGIYSYANFTAWMIWNLSKLLKGKGSLVNTRTGILWSMVAYIPLGFSIHWIMFNNHAMFEPENFSFLNFLPILSFPFIFLYSLMLTLKMISEIQQFRLIYAFLSVLCCALIQVGFVVIVVISFR